VNMPYRSVSVSVLATNRLGFWNPLNILFLPQIFYNLC
jgi:hypothetical protein